MEISYILTALSPAMFGSEATVRMTIIDNAEARRRVSGSTRILATRSSHEQLARLSYPNAAHQPVRYANLQAGMSAIHMHYRGPPIGNDGQVPIGGIVTSYLIEVQR